MAGFYVYASLRTCALSLALSLSPSLSLHRPPKITGRGRAVNTR